MALMQMATTNDYNYGRTFIIACSHVAYNNIDLFSHTTQFKKRDCFVVG